MRELLEYLPTLLYLGLIAISVGLAASSRSGRRHW